MNLKTKLINMDEKIWDLVHEYVEIKRIGNSKCVLLNTNKRTLKEEIKKLLMLYGVSQQRELLNSFIEWENKINDLPTDKPQNLIYIDEFLKTIL